MRNLHVMTSPDPALADPMFRALRQRHPDVEIALLPPPAPITDRPPATPAQCRAIQAHAGAVLARVAAALGREPDQRVQHWWGQAHPEMRRWVVSATFGAPDGDGLGLLRGLGDTLARLGWDPRPAADGSPRLRGVAGPCELVASADDESVSVSVRCDPMYVPQSMLGAGAAV
jgi:hypothetical protein